MKGPEMAEQITFYSMRLATQDEPTGIARRRIDVDGRIVDEAFKRDLRWGRTSIIVSWERGDTTDELEEISEEEAGRLIERFRATLARSESERPEDRG